MKLKNNNEIPIRLDKFLSNEISSLSRENIKRKIKDGNIKVNNVIVKKANILIKNGDVILLEENVKEFENEKIKPWNGNIELEIIFENEDYIVLNKPKNLVVHPTSQNSDKTLINILMNMNKTLSTINLLRPGIVHRLDKNTTGLMVVAKTNEFHLFLQKQFENHDVKKIYWGLVVGDFKHNKGLIDAPIGRDQSNKTKMTVTNHVSKEAKTEFKVIEKYNNFTLVEFNLLTGRTHQIRVHAKYLGTPIYNDPVYSVEMEKGLGQYLFSKSISFLNLKNEEVFYQIEMPKYFKNKIDTLKKV